MHAREKEKEREREREKRKDEGEGGRPGQRESRAERKNAQASKRRTDLPRAVAVLQARQTHTQRKENPSRPQEKKVGRRRRKTRAEEKGGDPKKTPRNPRHPKTLRQSLPDRAKTVRLANRNNSTKLLQNKIRVHSPKPSGHKP